MNDFLSAFDYYQVEIPIKDIKLYQFANQVNQITQERQNIMLQKLEQVENLIYFFLGKIAKKLYEFFSIPDVIYLNDWVKHPSKY